MQLLTESLIFLFCLLRIKAFSFCNIPYGPSYMFLRHSDCRFFLYRRFLTNSPTFRQVKVKTKTRKRKPTPTKTVYTTDYTTRRKLKNVPEDQVELIKLREEDMWTVRKEDAVSEAFVNLKFKCCDCLRSFTTEKLMKGHLKAKHRPVSSYSIQA